ncbi:MULTISPECIES: acyltransferase family protein [Stutzerimonas stutzeri subgroup]|uniref:acyltransferase family protein n=1 Tax=Stutzerimonas stutzeri subgroup TaxID=578833 RepID=UPI000F778796|nr:acyltransferase [Stutzerimonas stutzeri]RRV84166.1 acyltransferase [Stutzerimonas stutzeri]
MPSTASRYAHIDAMRAIAVLLVIWMHTSEVFVPIAAPSVQDRLYEVAHSFDFGRIGVVVFFIISGFVIPASLRGPRAVGCYQFLIRRLFRLYPLYWLSIPFGLLTTWWLWGKEISLESILWNLSMVQEAAGHPSVQGLYWTLQTELIFYGLCVALYAIGLLHSALALSLVVTVFGGFTALAWGGGWIGLSIPFDIPPQALSLIVHLSLMFWGALVRHAHEHDTLPRLAMLVMIGFGAGWITVGLLVGAQHMLVRPNEALFRTFVPCAAGVAMFVSFATYMKLRARALVWLGTVSYSLYLFHPVAQYSLSWLVQATDIAVLKGWSTGSYMLATASLTIGISALTYRYVEVPFQALGGRIAKNVVEAENRQLA